MMTSNIISAITLCFLFSAIIPAADPPDFNLSDYRWENRIILLFAEYPSDDLYAQQITQLTNYEDGLIERELMVVSLFAGDESHVDGEIISNESSSALRKRFLTEDRSLKFILIGKDGGVKLRSDEFVSVHDLFGLIDSMPMRRQEMRGSSN